MAIEGELVVSCGWDGQRIRRVTVRSTRPLRAARVLEGRTAAHAAVTVPMLFSVCGGAQGAAATTALAAAGGTGLVVHDRGRETGVLLEALRDGFWHLLIDWPGAAGVAPQVTPVATARHQMAAAARTPDGEVRLADADAMRALGVTLEHVAAKSIYGIAPAAWLAMPDVDALAAWAAATATTPARLLRQQLADAPALGRSDVALLPRQTPDTLATTMLAALRDDPQFETAPTWQGAPAETGALARMHGHPLVAAAIAQFGCAVVTRNVARLAEVATMLAELDGTAAHAAAPRITSAVVAPGEALCAVDTARGLLLHRVQIAADRVVAYQIVAPTEWNFHPDGALPRELAGAPAGDRAQVLRTARLAIHALDPCVAYRVEVAHA